MVGYYRLTEIDARLESGAYVIPEADFAAIDEATKLLEAAESRSAEIVADAQRIYAQEKERGYKDGHETAQIDAVKRLVEESRGLDQALVKLEQELSQLVASCVRKIIYNFDDVARAEAVVRQALSKMRKEKRVELRAPQPLFGFFLRDVDRIRRDFPEIELIDVVEDDELEADQVIVETSVGRVDGNLGRRFEELTAALLQSLGISAAGPATGARPMSPAPPNGKSMRAADAETHVAQTQEGEDEDSVDFDLADDDGQDEPEATEEDEEEEEEEEAEEEDDEDEDDDETEDAVK